MTESDFTLIERELSVQLPPDYRRVLADYPFPHDRDNADSLLYGDSQAIIDRNRDYRAGFAGLPKWPEHYFFIGDDGAASCYFLDLRREPSPVYFADHGAVDKLAEEAPDLETWVERTIDDFRRDGIDPFADAPPSATGLHPALVLLTIAAVSAGVGYTLFRLFWP